MFRVNFSCNIRGCCMMLLSFGQIRATMLRQGMRTSSISTRNMSKHVATGWPNACNMLRPTMLRSVQAFKCCDRLAGTCKCWANNVGICCVEMLRSFGRGFSMEQLGSPGLQSSAIIRLYLIRDIGRTIQQTNVFELCAKLKFVIRNITTKCLFYIAFFFVDKLINFCVIDRS